MTNEKVIELLKIAVPQDESFDEEGLFIEAVSMVIEALEQVSPRGKWVKISPANIYECSKCGKNVMTNDISEYNFCHGCGADMRRDKDGIN